jgi:hypothetical protein
VEKSWVEWVERGRRDGWNYSTYFHPFGSRTSFIFARRLPTPQQRAKCLIGRRPVLQHIAPRSHRFHSV